MRVIGCFGSNGFDLGCGLRELGLGSSASAWENSIDHGLVKHYADPKSIGDRNLSNEWKRGRRRTRRTRGDVRGCREDK